MAMPGSEIANLISAIAVLIVLGVYVCAFHFGVNPFQRDFFCNDESISYPYKPDTVTMAVAAAVGALIILLSVVVIEAVRHSLRHGRSTLSDRGYAAAIACCCPEDSRRALAVVSIVRILVLAALGALVTEVVTVTVKTILGRQRPHFLAICRPNFTAPEFTVPCGGHLPISAAVVCRPDNAKLYKESMLSFPSGHSSHSMYMTVFASLYLQSRFTFAKGHAVKWFLQCLIIVWGLAVCASRVSDYKHHWSDVLGGGCIGAVVGCIVCLYLRPSYLINCCRATADASSESADSEGQIGTAAAGSPPRNNMNENELQGLTGTA